MRPQTDTKAATVPAKEAQMDTKAGAATTPPYDDFEPFCNWRREEGQETLLVHLPEFKREQLKVHISNSGNLKITGERPIDGIKWSRFSKEIKIPKDCDPKEINAKFTSAGLLYIGMPKKLTAVTKQDQPIPAKQSQENQRPKSEGTQAQGTKKPGLEFSVRELIGGRKAAMTVAVGVVVVVLALGAYTTYKCRSSDSSSCLSNSSNM